MSVSICWDPSVSSRLKPGNSYLSRQENILETVLCEHLAFVEAVVLIRLHTTATFTNNGVDELRRRAILAIRHKNSSCKEHKIHLQWTEGSQHGIE